MLWSSCRHLFLEYFGIIVENFVSQCLTLRLSSLDILDRLAKHDSLNQDLVTTLVESDKAVQLYKLPNLIKIASSQSLLKIGSQGYSVLTFVKDVEEVVKRLEHFAKFVNLSFEVIDQLN